METRSAFGSSPCKWFFQCVDVARNGVKPNRLTIWLNGMHLHTRGKNVCVPSCTVFTKLVAFREITRPPTELLQSYNDFRD